MRLVPKLRVFVIDTLAMTFLTSVPAAAVEFFLLGLPAERVLGLRMFATATSLATGGLYGRWRDLCVSWVARNGQSRFARAKGDIAANLSFTVVLYPLQLLLFGASRTQMVRGTATALLACIVVGPITGLVLEVARAGVRAGFRPRAVLEILRLRSGQPNEGGNKSDAA